MANITKEELLKLAKLSHISITDQEADTLVPDLESVLTYASRVSTITSLIAAQPTHEASADASIFIEAKNENVFREDVIVPTSAEPLLELAPQRTYDYYVVPMILESNE